MIHLIKVLFYAKQPMSVHFSKEVIWKHESRGRDVTGQSVNKKRELCTPLGRMVILPSHQTSSHYVHLKGLRTGWAPEDFEHVQSSGHPKFVLHP